MACEHGVTFKMSECVDKAFIFISLLVIHKAILILSQVTSGGFYAAVVMIL